jgi:hypothetical protein
MMQMTQPGTLRDRGREDGASEVHAHRRHGVKRVALAKDEETLVGQEPPQSGFFLSFELFLSFESSGCGVTFRPRLTGCRASSP